MKKAKTKLCVVLVVLIIFSIMVAVPATVNAAGNSIANATNISLSSTVNGSITASNTRDFYKISVSGNSSIQLKLKLVSYIYRVNIIVYDSSGEELFSDRPYWNSNTNQTTENYTLYLDHGIYYVEIYDDYYTGNYTLSTSYTNLNNLDVSYDDTIASARSVELTKTFTGVLTHTEKSDIYKINIQSPGILNCEFSAYMYRVNLKLMDSEGNELSSENPYWNSNIGYSVNNYVYALEKGTYYLQVFDNYYNGKYVFKNQFSSIGSTEIEKNDTIATANSVYLGKTVVGLIGEDENSDIYKVVIPKSGKVNVNIKAYMYRINLVIYSSSGDELYSQNPYWDSKVGYSNNNYEYTLSAGTYYFQVNESYYTGKYKLSIVQPKVLKSSNTKISSISSKVFSGKYIKPSVTVKFGSTKLKQGTDYSVSYSDNYYVGKATVKITGKGNYTGTLYKTFKIIPKAVKLRKLKNAKKKSLFVKWSRNRNASGYKISYSTNKTFKKAKSYITSWSSTTSVKLYKLKKNKKYYVKVQAYNWSGGKRVYSKNSNVKSKKINK